MHHLRLGLALATLLAIVSTIGVVAQPSPAEAEARTTQIPGTDVAVTLPTDWRIWVSSGPDGSAMVINDVLARQQCAFRLAEGFSSASAAVDDLLNTLARHDPTIIEQRSFEVPVGEAEYVAYRYGAVPDEPRYAWYEYYVTVPSGVISVACSADEPPPDRWGSIIDSMHILEATPGPSPVFDPRVEVPAHGLAIEFPPEWLVGTWPDWRGVVLGGDFVLRAVTQAGAQCWLEDETGISRITSLDSLDDWRAAFGEANDGRWAQRTPMAPGRHATEPLVVAVDLPSGPGVRADWQDWGGMPATAWAFRSPDRAVVLFCRADDPPADAWLSIAETFEFVPEAAGD
jgi:hypothetical protein